MAYGTLGQIGIPLHLTQMGRSITVVGPGIDDINMGERIKPLLEKGAALGFSAALARARLHRGITETVQSNTGTAAIS